MRNIIDKFKDFLVESVKDNIPACGWKEITMLDYYKTSLRTEEFTEEELNYLKDFSNKKGFPDTTESSYKWHPWLIKLQKDDVRLVIIKYQEEWFIVESAIDKPDKTHQNYYIVDQNGLRESNYGLKDLLETIIR